MYLFYFVFWVAYELGIGLMKAFGNVIIAIIDVYCLVY